MASTDFTWLDTAEEDLLHHTRLLPVEQKTFQRIARRLLQRDSLVSKRPTQLPSPPPDSAGDSVADKVALRERDTASRQQWREDVLLDFAALESSMVRIQLLQNSNERERKRYADEKVKIMESMEAIKNNTAELRGQLEEAQSTKKLRTEYDALADAILRNQTLKSREDQEESMRKTTAEIAEEETKGREYEERWARRHEQFGRILAECKALQNIIKDEKEEAARKQGMEGESDAGSMPATPAAETGDATPMPNHDVGALKPLPAGSRMGSRAASRAPSLGPGEINDIAMVDAVPTPGPSSLEEGEEGEASEAPTPMETQ